MNTVAHQMSLHLKITITAISTAVTINSHCKHHSADVQLSVHKQNSSIHQTRYYKDNKG